MRPPSLVFAVTTSLCAACGSSMGGPLTTSPGDSGVHDRDGGGPSADSGHPDAPADARVTDSRADAPHAEDGDASDGAGACSPVPPGAAALKYGTLAFCVEPTTADISYTSTPSTKLYSGNWYDTPPASTYYSMDSGHLAIALGGGVMTQRQDSKQGALPYLLAGNGFYVEFAITLSGNDPDHWPAVWLMPQEHDLMQSDHLSTDPAGYERWMEIDCDEGGFYSGSLNSLISWEGIYPKYTNTTWNDYGKLPALDRTVEHVFGVSYDPAGQVVQYWLDGAATYSHSTSTINSVVDTYHYYLLMDAQTHGTNVPYTMIVRYAGAWIK